MSDAETSVLKIQTNQHHNHRSSSMKTLMDKTLREYIEDAYEWPRLRRIGDFPDREAVFAEILANLESDGEAMRYINSEGQIAWKATPDLRDYLRDLRLDAEAEMEDEEV